jgi:hypothetical protein
LNIRAGFHEKVYIIHRVVSGTSPAALRNWRGAEDAVLLHLILAALTGWAVMHLTQSLALAVAAASGLVLLHLVRRARAMWRDAHD